MNAEYYEMADAPEQRPPAQTVCQQARTMRPYIVAIIYTYALVGTRRDNIQAPISRPSISMSIVRNIESYPTRSMNVPAVAPNYHVQVNRTPNIAMILSRVNIGPCYMQRPSTCPIRPAIGSDEPPLDRRQATPPRIEQIDMPSICNSGTKTAPSSNASQHVQCPRSDPIIRYVRDNRASIAPPYAIQEATASAT